ncbi:MAG: phosphatidylcholine/phosphatidylserine synthase [Candidatus Tokpelaia sp.]|nr:MAG: phosphatidylcholine/phosphatidylserine synthase [Candidatus Tokpelaia sp.]KAA6206938.1 MAG: phosphatidylcholine/phosphatidylserine synthase [Candidatus Tokpelaia sp.]
MKPSLPFPPFDGDKKAGRLRRFDADNVFGQTGQEGEAQEKQRKFISFRFLLPNIITVVAIISGLSGVRMAIENRFEPAVICLLLAAFLDGIDGRIARAIRGTSRFGEQLDSLADAINFGAVPALVVYIYILDAMGRFGWLAALIYSTACCLRLARFNVMIDNSNSTPKWQQNYFVGLPSPAGGCLLLLPVCLGFLGMPQTNVAALFFCFYTIFLALLMVCNLPVWNGKAIRGGLRRDIVIPALFFVVIYLILLVSYMWETLAVTCFIYLAFLPLSAYSYYRLSKKQAGR